MTAICPGGANGIPKPGVVDHMIFADGLLGLVDLAPGMQWLIPFIAGLGVLTYETPAVCLAGPVGFPTFTGPELVAVALADPGPLGFSGRQKVLDTLQTIFWYAFCDCSGATTPSLPTVPSDPGNVQVSGSSSNQVCVPMLAADCKVLNLWNGTTNVAPPAGWDAPGFDDSAWAVGTVATSLNSAASYYTSGVGVNVTGVVALPSIACVGELVAPFPTPTSGKEQFLVRWRFNLPPFDRNNIVWHNVFEAQAGFGWNTGTCNITGPGAFTCLNTVAIETVLRGLKTGPNILAIWVDSGNTANAVAWGTNGSIGVALSQNGQNGPFVNPVGCCPPDAASIALWNAILQQITLVQRQISPFAYIASTAHTGLTGNGQFTVQGILGLAVTLTTTPGRLGQVSGDPTSIFEAGWINVGTVDGWGPREFISSSPFLLRPIPGDITRVGYSIPADVVVTITELVREP